MAGRHLILASICSAIVVSLVDAEAPPGFRPANAIPDEFFTCTDRVPGLYADDKRSCVFYWNCSTSGTLDHERCPPSAPFFDDRTRECVTGDKCPVEYGHFQSAASFCRGRPNPSLVGLKRQKRKKTQAYYPNLLNNCDSYFRCSLVNGQWDGREITCSKGEKFDEYSAACKNETSVICKISHGADIVW